MKPADRMQLIASWLRAKGASIIRFGDNLVGCLEPGCGMIIIDGYGANDPLQPWDVADFLEDLVFAQEAVETITPMGGSWRTAVAATNSTSTVDIFIFVWRELWERERHPWDDDPVRC